MSAETAAWFADWWPIWAPLLALAVGGSVAGIWALVNRRDGERVARKSPLPPTWPEMWARIDAQDARIDGLETEVRGKDAHIAELVAEGRRKDGAIDELISHIVFKLEPLIDTPPGPPARPAWITR